jgi:protein-S-isoprenylcysteine O-methyltransferase Ste14
MPLSVPIAMPQIWFFDVLSLAFFGLVIRAMLRRERETGGRREGRSRLGILLQGIAIGSMAVGPVRPSLPWFSSPAIAGCVGVLILMGGAVALFAWSSRTLGRNWSIEARTLADHELVRTGPYARVRHPIYLAMLLFLLGFAVALGHYLQLVIAIPLFLIGTRLRTDAEERLLEQSFGAEFRVYRDSTPALFPKMWRRGA